MADQINTDESNSYLVLLRNTLEKREKEIKKLTRELSKQKDEINTQKEIIENQRDVALRQRDEIAQHQKDIMASFMYASRIQAALLSSDRLFDAYFQNYFILYKPRDIVSGDFYWMHQGEKKVVVTAADSTGHGVPGAFMSLMGMVFLNEIVATAGVEKPDQILEMMREKIISAFGQDISRERINAGMDLALITIDQEEMNLDYAGAFNPAIIIRNKEVIELKGDKMPIGYHPYLMEHHFTSQSFELKKGDRIYLFSDGYVDQFGWRNNKKYMKKNFKKLLLEVQKVPMKAQKMLLENSFKNWKGDLDQVDDIVVLGMEI